MMQQQMAVCDLDAVDFVECQIEEYNSREAYKADYLDNKPDQLSFIKQSTKGCAHCVY